MIADDSKIFLLLSAINKRIINYYSIKLTYYPNLPEVDAIKKAA